MGNCSKHELDMEESSEEKKPENQKEELLMEIRAHLKNIEQYIVQLRKEDVHYRMEKLLFIYQALKDSLEFITQIEDSPDNFDYTLIKPTFEEAFLALWKFEQEKFKEKVHDIKEFFVSNKIPQKAALATPTPI